MTAVGGIDLARQAKRPTPTQVDQGIAAVRRSGYFTFVAVVLTTTAAILAYLSK